MNIELPSAPVMLERLQAVSSITDFTEHFYPLLVKSAGRKNDVPGVIMTIELAISDSSNKIPALRGALTLRMHDWISALIPSPEAAAEARNFWTEAKRHISAHKA